MKFEIIDFHIHPYFTSIENICHYDKSNNLDFTPALMERLGVSKFCGSVLSHESVTEENVWQILSTFNNHALKLYDYYKGMYVAGCHVHPNHVKEQKKQLICFIVKGLGLLVKLCLGIL